jgi:predicted RND superfamily exporter protein
MKQIEAIAKIPERYAHFLTRRYGSIIIFSLVFTLLALYGMQLITSKGTDYTGMLPDSIPTVSAFKFIGDEFGESGQSTIIIIQVDPSLANSNEPRDVRDPDVLLYMNQLGQETAQIENTISVSSAATLLKSINNGQLPKTRVEALELMNKGIGLNSSSSADASSLLAQSGSGLEKIQGGLQAEAAAQRQIAQGLNSSATGLLQISKGLKTMATGFSSATGPDFSPMTSGLDQISLLVNYSSATPSEKTQILGALQQMKAGVENAAVAQGQVGNSLTQVTNNLDSIQKGLITMANATNQMQQTNLILASNIQLMSSGLGQMASYLSMSQSSSKAPKKLDIFGQYVSSDYSTAVIRIGMSKMSDSEQQAFVKELNQILQNSQPPIGVKVSATGDVIISQSIAEMIGPETGFLTAISFIGILVLVFLIFLSIKYGLISMIPIVFGTLWFFGLIGFMGWGMSSELVGILSMVMGVGVDFGIQLVTRFRLEIKGREAEKAMAITLKNVMVPMITTTVAIIAGFKALSFGQLTFLAKMGDMLGLGIFMCFVAAMTVLPGTLLMLEKRKEKKLHLAKDPNNV